MKLLESTKIKIIKDKNGDDMPYLEITKIVLIYYNIDNNGCQQDSTVSHKFVPNKWFGQLLDILPNILYFLKIIFFKSYIEVWFSDSKPLEIEDKLNITLVIN